MKNSKQLTFEDFFKQIEKNNYNGTNKLINLGQGNPKIQIPEKVICKFGEYLQDYNNHQYPNQIFLNELKSHVRNLYRERFRANLGIENIGIYDGAKKIFYLLFKALLNSTSTVLLIDPAYPDYEKILLHVTQNIIKFPVYKGLPNISEIETLIQKHDINLIIFNYPNNPTGAIANNKFWQDINTLSIRHNVFIVNDFTYSDYVFNGKPSTSLLQHFQENNNLIEIYSFSKNFTIPGWRVASIIADKKIITSVTNIDSLMSVGIFTPIVKTLNYIFKNYGNSSFVTPYLYKENMEYTKNKLSSIKNWEIIMPESGMFLWIYIGQEDSWEYFVELLNNQNIIVLPGKLYGDDYKNYIRLSMNTNFIEIDRLKCRLETH